MEGIRMTSTLFKRLSLVLAGLSFVVIAGALFYTLHVTEGKTYEVPLLSASEKEMRAYWSARVAQDPGEVVYAEFKEMYLPQDENRWHWGMHILASLLYERYGNDAVRYCDDSFQQACYHELMSSYAYEGKVTHTEEVEALCKGEWNCLHGVGHGLVMYFGYDSATLPEIIDICPEEGNAVPIQPCASGIFMEYITRTMGTPRLDADELPYNIEREFCSQFEQKKQGPCHFVMIERIIAETKDGEDGLAQAVGKYCRSVSEHKRECFIGVGFNAKFIAEDEAQGIAFCNAAASENKIDDDTCLTALAMQYTFFKKPRSVDFVCEATSAKETCIRQTQ